MNNLEKYTEIGKSIDEAVSSNFFGKPCFKLGGKAFLSFFQNEMVFKLTDIEVHKEAISLSGAKLFDPSGKNRPMKQWVQIPIDYSDKWKYFAEKATESVSTDK